MTDEKPYREIDHTADVGVEVTGSSLAKLFENSAQALFELLAERKRPGTEREMELVAVAEDPESLLVRFLNELLFIAGDRDLVLTRCRVKELNNTGITAVITGEAFDPHNHERLAEIKTTTYHDLKIEQDDSQWSTTILFDV